MKATQLLHNLGQSIWLDSITRDLLACSALSRHIDELSVTGPTSNPTIFNQAIKNSSDYAVAIREKFAQGKSAEEVFLNSHRKTLSGQPICFVRSTTVQTESADGFPLKFRRCSHTTPTRPWPLPKNCMLVQPSESL